MVRISADVVAEFCPVSGPQSLSREDLLALVDVQRGTIEELQGLVARQAARIAELERRLGRNSGNSSLAPSSDAFVRPVKAQAPKSARRRGR